MKNRKADLQKRLDAAIKTYRTHIESVVPEAEAEATAHAERAERMRAEMDSASRDLRAECAALDAERVLGSQSTAIDRDSEIVGGEDRAAKDPRGGFNTIGEYIRAVIQAANRNNRAIDSRLTIEAQAPTSGANESTGADGGYLVPMEFSNIIFAHSLDEGSFLQDTFQLPITGNQISFPTDETTPWGTDGVRMYWAAEMTAGTQTKPVLKERTLKLRKLLGLVPLTDELMADASAAGAYCSRLLGRSLAWKTNDAIVNGSGDQVPLGYRSTGALITQTAEAAQTADTVNTQNISKMFGRLPSSSMRSSKLRWLLNNDVLNQVMTLTLGNMPIWTPPQAGFQAAPAGFLLGRPIVPTQVCQTLGDAGDIQLVDFAQYVSIAKGPEYAQSMHLFFDYDMNCLRLVFRMDGMPWQSAAVTPANGSNSLSPFVELAARA